ncbi:butyrophilin-like protein 2 [Colossoma macropomum]|uniref:butyrophilin-like protein 2 n=1 Tax=Colossoma macropomum TaxID=42526 RepID=UPI001863BCD5|nr:butyrophilin-like protein 2 [Colossoma macropomum]
MMFVPDLKMSLIICLFVLGVLFICDGLHVLGPSDPLIVELGGSVMLPCYVETPIPLEKLEVEWKRTDSETLVHLFQDGESQPETQDQAYSGRASFFTEEVECGNFSLLLTNLTTKDAGVYNCFVYSQQETGKTSVEIKTIERLIVTGGHVVSAYVGEDITMNCSVDSSVPPEKLEEVSWKKVDQQIQVLIFQNGVVQTESTHERYTDRVEFFSPEIQKGNFSFRLKDLRTEDKGLYICEAFFGEFAANTTVEVQELDMG